MHSSQEEIDSEISHQHAKEGQQEINRKCHTQNCLCRFHRIICIFYWMQSYPVTSGGKIPIFDYPGSPPQSFGIRHT